jgi:hypothetical protein
MRAAPSKRDRVLLEVAYAGLRPMGERDVTSATLLRSFLPNFVLAIFCVLEWTIMISMEKSAGSWHRMSSSLRR